MMQCSTSTTISAGRGGSRASSAAAAATPFRHRHHSVRAAATLSGGNQQQPPAAGPTATSNWSLYTGRMPLVGLEPVAELLDRTPLRAASSRLLYLHTYLLLEGLGPAADEQPGVWYLDFLPLNATSPGTALPLLTGGRVPGEVRVRKLGTQQVKAGDNVRLLGQCCHPDPLMAVEAYNREYDRRLHLLLNNCTHYTNGLARVLLTTPARTVDDEE